MASVTPALDSILSPGRAVTAASHTARGPFLTIWLGEAELGGDWEIRKEKGLGASVFVVLEYIIFLKDAPSILGKKGDLFFSVSSALCRLLV